MQEPYHYIRTVDGGDHYILVVGGEDHKTGIKLPGSNPWDSLEKYARARWTYCEEVLFKWDGQVRPGAGAGGVRGTDGRQHQQHTSSMQLRWPAPRS